jgi:hypothetical protein
MIQLLHDTRKPLTHQKMVISSTIQTIVCSSNRLVCDANLFKWQHYIV